MPEHPDPISRIEEELVELCPKCEGDGCNYCELSGVILHFCPEGIIGGSDD